MNEQSKITTTIDRPPENALRVFKWDDLPRNRSKAVFKVAVAGSTSRLVKLSKNKRVVLEGLIDQPIYAASPCRISDIVLLLRNDCGLNIQMDLYSNDHETGRAKFGVYTLVDQVQLVYSEVV